MSDFISFARAHGLEINQSKFSPSDKIRRCGTVDKPRSTNGAYMWDGQRGFVFNWAEEATAQWYEDPSARRWTEQEKANWIARRRAAKASSEQAYQEAARRAHQLMMSASVGTHPYLHIKGFPERQGLILPHHEAWNHEAECVRRVHDVLLVPMYTLSGVVAGVQMIWWDEPARVYQKKMLAGIRARGAVFRLGDKEARETALVEGYATGLSVQEAIRSIGLRASVLVCFSAGNMEHVAPMINGKTWVFADNDNHKTGQGEKSAKATGLPYCMSEVDGYDANDVHLNQGIMKVCHLVMQARRA